ncbi:MAG: MFS transporter [Candidatus Hydrogenedentes bacterium]|nr:MFS transporter [Candidatus Hydrogenedentota bacterium]
MEETLTAEQRAWRWRILISTFLGYAAYYFCRKVFGLVKTSLDEQFGWGLDSIAFIWAVFLVAYMIGQFVNGFVGRKWGPRVLLLGGLGLSIVCNVVFAFIDSKDVILAGEGAFAGAATQVNGASGPWPSHAADGGPVFDGAQAYDGTGTLTAMSQEPLETFTPNDYLFVHAFLDPDDSPTRLDVTWHTSLGDRTASWGEPDEGEVSQHVDSLPRAGQWVRLGVTGAELGLTDGTATIGGFSVANQGGHMSWDDLGVAKHTNLAYCAFLVFMFFNGLVQASGWPGAVGSVSQWVRPQERGFIMGGWGTSYVWGNLGVKVLGSTLLGLGLLALPGWRLSFLGCSLVAVVVWWVLYFWQRNKPEDVGLQPIVDVAADEAGRAIRASNEEHVSLWEYVRLAFNPLILAMGLGYFFIKFLRYALDSWLPTFLALQGLSKQEAGLYSTLFDIGGILPCILIGWVLDRYFRGNWAKLTFIASIGLILGYVCVLRFETNPVLVAVAFGLVGFMIYGPDTLLCGAAAVAVAGELNGVAVAGLVNGIGSFGPVVQELVIGKIMTGSDKMANIHTTNVMAFWMSVAFAAMMLVVMWRVRAAHAGNKRLDAENGG